MLAYTSSQSFVAIAYMYVRAPPMVGEKLCVSINVKFFIVVTLSYFLIIEQGHV